MNDALAHYAEHGYARLGKLLTEPALSALRLRAEELMLGRVVHPGMFFQMDSATGRYEDTPIGEGWQGPSPAYRKLEKLELDPLFRAWIESPLLAPVVRHRLAGPVSIYRAVLFNKGEGGGSDVPWHQDGGKLWGLSQEPELQLWTALDDAPEGGGCLEVLPGSHRAGLATPLGGVIPEAKVAEAQGPVVALPAEAGEVILVHNHLWHRSRRSVSGRTRRALSVCYLDAATRCLRTRRAPRTFFPVFR